MAVFGDFIYSDLPKHWVPPNRQESASQLASTAPRNRPIQTSSLSFHHPRKPLPSALQCMRLGVKTTLTLMVAIHLTVCSPFLNGITHDLDACQPRTSNPDLAQSGFNVLEYFFPRVGMFMTS